MMANELTTLKGCSGGKPKEPVFVDQMCLFDERILNYLQPIRKTRFRGLKLCFKHSLPRIEGPKCYGRQRRNYVDKWVSFI